MVWSGYVAEAHERGIITSPKSPKSPKFTRKKSDPRRKIDTEDAIDLFFYMNGVRGDVFCDNMLLDVPEYNSYSLEYFCNTRNVDIELDAYYTIWDNEYYWELDFMRQRLNTSLKVMGKKINLTKGMFRAFVYKYSSGYLRQN